MHELSVTNDLEQSWQLIRAELRRAVTDSTFHLWLEPLNPQQLDSESLVLEAPDEIRKWVADRFGRLLSATASSTLGRTLSVEIVSSTTESKPKRATVKTSIRNKTSTSARNNSSPATHKLPPSETINPRFTFDQFVIGDSNRLAHGAALAVAEMPGLAYNPLFICGTPGLGKTHLLHSIANYVATYGNGLTVRYATVETFTNHFLAALTAGGMEAFKATYRGVDLLLIDDIQFLQSKLKTEQEFFHTFNALYTAGAQIVLTSDRPPKDMDALEDRLRERFEAGLVTDIQPPEYEMRLTILRKRVQQDGLLGVDPAALELIADRVASNIRALEGALIRIVAFGSLTGKPVTTELAEEVLSGLYNKTKSSRPPSLTEIQSLISDNFGITRDELISTNRSAALTYPRQLAMYLSRELTQDTLPKIGSAFGGRAHTTVMHAHRRVAELIKTNSEVYSVVEKLTEQLVDGCKTS